MERNVQTMSSNRPPARARHHLISVVLIGLGAVVGILCIIIGFGRGAAAQSGDAVDASVDQPSAAREVGRIEAEDYDAGEPGIAYSDTDGAVGGYRMNDDVDAFIIDNVPASGALLGRTRDGEFVRYTVSVAEAGDYVIRLRVASR